MRLSVQDPHACYRQLRQADPVHEVAGTGTFVVTRMNLIHQVVGDTGTFSSGSGEFLHLGDWPGASPPDVGLVERRRHPPFRGHYRVVTRDTQLGGKQIPAGSHLLLAWPAANRDDAVYDQPDEIPLDRPKPRHHVGFGWGIPLGVGAPLARVEAKVAIETLLTRTRRFTLDTAQLPLRYHPSLVVRRLVSLPLLLEPA